MISQIEGDIVTSGGCPDDDNLLPNVVLRGRVRQRVDSLSLKFFLKQQRISPVCLRLEK